MTDSTHSRNPIDRQEKTMQKIWLEVDVTLGALAAHLRDSGLEINEEGSRIMLHTEAGIGYLLRLDMDRKFVRISTVLPLDPQQLLATRKDFALALNEDFFLPSFSVDDSGDLRISYVMSYRQGLIAGQFMAIVHRFGSLLDYLVAERNTDGVISFDAEEVSRDENSDDATGHVPEPRVS
jgi:hypothetical protein